ncbi:hypothetical protein [Aggregatilinea lenta]|uniref:hypothetical protein n=1 Tax=Aggregatilinea lenta TaxID=913108 RepID=UPI000E5A1354|nr:hypothetical protein [Aggregatilinea lenta]
MNDYNDDDYARQYYELWPLDRHVNRRPRSSDSGYDPVPLWHEETEEDENDVRYDDSIRWKIADLETPFPHDREEVQREHYADRGEPWTAPIYDLDWEEGLRGYGVEERFYELWKNLGVGECGISCRLKEMPYWVIAHRSNWRTEWEGHEPLEDWQAKEGYAWWVDDIFKSEEEAREAWEKLIADPTNQHRPGVDSHVERYGLLSPSYEVVAEHFL